MSAALVLGLKLAAGAPIVRLLIRSAIDCEVEGVVDCAVASIAVAVLAFVLGVIIGA